MQGDPQAHPMGFARGKCVSKITSLFWRGQEGVLPRSIQAPSPRYEDEAVFAVTAYAAHGEGTEAVMETTLFSPRLDPPTADVYRDQIEQPCEEKQAPPAGW